MIEFDGALQRGTFQLNAKFTAGEGITALFGPSGSGKSTVLRLIAGLEKPDHGRITLQGEAVYDAERALFVPAHRRGAALVFQDAQLFPHLRVLENLNYGGRFRKAGSLALPFDHVVTVLGLARLLDRMPAALSGGERQRIAIGRALLAAPRVLLLDEPLASLDMALKLEILPLIEDVRDQFGIPIVYVSHAVEEVARLAQSVVRLGDGKVLAVGTPAEVLAPAAEGAGGDRFEAISMLDAKVSRVDFDYDVTFLSHPAGTIVVPGKAAAGRTSLRVAIRATNVTLSLTKPVGLSVRTVLQGTVSSIAAGQGPFAVVTIALKGGGVIYAYTTRLALADMNLTGGMPVFALAKSVAIDERGIAGRGA